jgi:transcriptional regulator with XRE-family HTH domain
MEKGLSQEKLAELSDLDRTYVSLVERGKRIPMLTTLVKIAKGLDISLAELFAEVEKEH